MAEIERHRKPNRGPVTLIFSFPDLAHEVNMPRDKVPSQAIADDQRTLEIHRGPWLKMDQVGASQRLVPSFEL